MPSGVLQRSQRLAIGQDNRPIEALIPGHDAQAPENALPTSHVIYLRSIYGRPNGSGLNTSSA
jgi:hypothetical protein